MYVCMCSLIAVCIDDYKALPLFPVIAISLLIVVVITKGLGWGEWVAGRGERMGGVSGWLGGMRTSPLSIHFTGKKKCPLY